MSRSAKRKLRDKKRKEGEEKRARGEGEAPAPKIYRAWFMLRDSFFENNKTLQRHDVLQIPDMIRKLDMKDAGKSISGPHRRSKRLPFRTEADKRGVEHGRMLDFMLFSRGEMIDMFMEASLRGEGFMTPEDLEAAAALEMQHAFGQGIISKELSLENAHLTLKALFLYIRSPGSERWAKDPEFWGGVVDIAVRSNAGLCLLDVFKDEGDVNHAFKWMQKIEVNKTLPMANRIFISPMFANEDKIEDDGVDVVSQRCGYSGCSKRGYREFCSQHNTQSPVSAGSSAGEDDGDTRDTEPGASSETVAAPANPMVTASAPTPSPPPRGAQGHALGGSSDKEDGVGSEDRADTELDDSCYTGPAEHPAVDPMATAPGPAPPGPHAPASGAGGADSDAVEQAPGPHVINVVIKPEVHVL